MRGSGVLMHITSLPGPYGVGTMGAQAYEFVDFLEKSGQKFWQVLPLNPTGYGDSPYQSCSAYAGNHYLIDLKLLVEKGLLQERQIQAVQWCVCDNRVDYGLLYQNRLALLRLAYANFSDWSALDDFCRKNSRWLPDFALYMALKDQNDGKAWYQWDAPLRSRQADAVWQARQDLKEDIRFYCFVQYLFDDQWHKLKHYANCRGIRVIGDVPIYVPLDSVDVWSNPELFQLDENLIPTAVAGCPPDAFTQDGQLWGNPLYRWDVLAKDGYDWWLQRLTAAAERYDMVRLDHFRGFEAYWSVPYGDVTAKGGKWVKGPGMDFIQAVKNTLPELELIAEDLGFLTPEVLQLRDESGFPGMKVLQFAFEATEPSDYLPHNCGVHTVCYTGTHDNMTTKQWFCALAPDAQMYAAEYMKLSDDEGIVWGIIRTAQSTASALCIVPMQDYLNLDGDARMNFPGTQSGSNWTWRAELGCFTNALAERICRLVQLYGR